MKKLACLLFAALLLFCFSGCEEGTPTAGSTLPKGLGTDPATLPTQPTEPAAEPITYPTSPETNPAEPEENATETTEPATHPTDPATEELVELTFPSSFFSDGEASSFNCEEYAQENQFISAVLNDDNSLTVVMTKTRHEEVVAETISDTEAGFAEFVNAENTPYIKEITHSDDFTSITMKVDRELYENSFDLTYFSLGISGYFVQFIMGIEYQIDVIVEDYNTGETLKTIAFPLE